MRPDGNNRDTACTYKSFTKWIFLRCLEKCAAHFGSTTEYKGVTNYSKLN